MNTNRVNKSGSNSMSTRFRRRIGPALLTLLAALALALTVSARAGTQPAAIPFSDIGARATANYQGDALGVTATADGARLRCGFQKLEGHATPEGLWLESTKPGGGKLRLVTVAVGRGEALAGSAQGACAGGTSENSPAFQRWDQCGQALSREATAGLAPRFSRPYGTSSVIRPNPALKRWAIVKSPSGTELPRTGTVSVADKLVRFTRPGLTEEYSVSVDGVRQDFIIESPPLDPQPLGPPKRSDGGSTLNQPAGDLRVELALSGARAEAAAGGAKLRLDGSGRALAYSPLRVEDATGRQLTARLEVLSPDRLVVSVADAKAIYPVRIDPTFSDADWVSLNSLPGANFIVWAVVADGNGNVYVGGQFTVTGTVRANFIAKWDGSTWSPLGSGMNSTVVWALAVIGTNLYAGGDFTTAGGVPANYIAKWNGSVWSALGSGTDGSVRALAVSGADLYAGGDFSKAGGVAANFIAKWNGSTWSALGSGMSNPLRALAVSGTALYAGGTFTTAGGIAANYVAKWDGSAWSALGSGMGGVTYPHVSALAVDGAGHLFAGGYFTMVDGVPANCIAEWTGGFWRALGLGIGGYNSSIEALAFNGINLYAGGTFTTAGGVPANNIAKWDGSAWSALGSGMSGQVYALAVSRTNLYAGGQLDLVGGVPAANIAKWDGSAWSALGSGTFSYFCVDAVAVSGTNLYAGSWANGIAEWDGSAWSALGSGVNGYVYTLAVMGTTLYAGGSLTMAGGVSVTNIAKWDGSAWSALGSGISGQVYALAVSGTNLYAGGYFTTAGGLPANYIAKWNGSAWSALGSGMGGISGDGVRALVLIGTNLYAGGGFTTAGGVPANYIAKWDGRVWSALGSGVNDRVWALAVNGNNLYAGGLFTTAGGVKANAVAKWDGSAWSALGSGVPGGGAAVLILAILLSK